MKMEPIAWSLLEIILDWTTHWASRIIKAAVKTLYSRSCITNGQYPGKVYYGSTTDGIYINAGATLDSDVPVYLMYEASSTNDEHNLLGH